MKSLIEKLVSIPGPSGYESQVRETILKEAEPFADDLHVDALGNLVVRKGNTHGLKLMLVAHMDEIGIIATHIDSNGFIRFTTIGGVYPVHCSGGRVRFLNGTQGVIGSEHLSSAYQMPHFEEMFIDVGATNRETCPIKIGDVAAFERPYMDLGSRLVAKSLDDRAGVAVLLDTLRRVHEPACDVYFVFSVQEEVGVRGATTAAYSIAPDLGIAVDVTRTGDTPKGVKMEVQLGKGPAIKVRDSGMIADPRVVEWMVNTAEAAKIPHQLEILEAGGTDARAIQVSRAGVPAGCLSLPCRYVHAPSEMIEYQDALLAADLLNAMIHHPLKV